MPLNILLLKKKLIVNGIDIIPENWLSELELKELIEEIAEDLFEQFR
jgi:hypothetical protein